MGRPSGLTDKVKADILQALRVGSTMKAAAAYGGVTDTTLYAWVAKGKAAKTGQYAEFADAVARARERCQVSDLAVIEQHAKTDWRAAAWRLERRFPDEFGKQKVEVSGNPNAPVHVRGEQTGELTLRASDPESADLAHKLLERLAGAEG